MLLVCIYILCILKSVTSIGSMRKTPKQNETESNTEVNSIESSPSTTPMHQVKNDFLNTNVATSFSSIDLQSPTNRNLSEKELRDCDVIGM